MSLVIAAAPAPGGAASPPASDRSPLMGGPSGEWQDAERTRVRVLAILAALARPLRRPEGAWPPRRVLVIRPDHLGDLLLATPALRLLRTQWPEAHVTALVGPWAAEVVRRNPHVDAVRRCDFPWFNRRPKRHAVEPYMLLLRAALALRAGSYHLALDLRFDFWWGAALAALAGIPRVAGYDWPTCRPFLTHPVPWRDGEHAVVQNLRLVGAVTGASESDVSAASRWPLEFAIRDGERKFAERILRHDGSWLALHPGSGATVKLWPLEHWRWLAERLAGSGYDLVWTGTSEERSLCAPLLRAGGGVVAAGATTLGQLAALYTRCRLVLGPDSGALHLAAAVGTPTVRLFGPADPALFGPHRLDRRHVVVMSPWPCAPCRRLDYPPTVIPYHRCLAGILPARVLAAAREVLAATDERESLAVAPASEHG